jgi:hypothetical protein
MNDPLGIFVWLFSKQDFSFLIVHCWFLYFRNNIRRRSRRRRARPSLWETRAALWKQISTCNGLRLARLTSPVFLLFDQTLDNGRKVEYSAFINLTQFEGGYNHSALFIKKAFSPRPCDPPQA